MPRIITPSRAEFWSALSRKTSKLEASLFSTDITSPVCLSSKKVMSSRCIFSKESVRTACITRWAKLFAATPYTHVNTAVVRKEPTMSAAENRNCAADSVGSHAAGTSGRV